MLIRFDDYELDTSIHELRHGDEKIMVEPQVFRVLVYLAENNDRMIPKEELLDNVWGDRFVSESALTTRIKQVRRAVGDDGRSQHVIKTVHGTGYRFVATIEGSEAATTTRPTASLPAPITPLIGRSADLETITGLVRSHRLVTLTGVGGVGKTRLAIAAASDLEFADGVRWVELAPVLDGAALPSAVAGALQITTLPDHSVVESLASAFAGQEMLLVLDNCEHLIDAVSSLVRGILVGADTIKILATSREDLRVEGEQVWSVPPLDTSNAGFSEAVELFVRRAEAATTGYSAADDDFGAIVEICRRLDGIALAIELAAARTASMSARQICDRLTDRFQFLGNARGSVVRHQTLRQAVRWSYDLLDDAEQSMLRCCSVFADGFDTAAVIAVGGEFDEPTAIDLLDALVHKSLVTVERIGGRVRFDMLETIRQFAADALSKTDTMESVRQRHADHYATGARQAYEHWRGPQQPHAVAWFQAETANLRVAFTWAADRDDMVTAGRIAAHSTIVGWPLQRFEPIGWAEQIVERATAARIPELPRVLAAASLCGITGRAAEAEAYDEQARAFEHLPAFDPFEPDIVFTLHGLTQALSGRVERWVDLAYPLVDDPDAGHAALDALLWHLPVLGRHEEAQAIADEALDRARQSGNPMWIAWALAGVGRAFATDDPVRALTTSRDAARYSREMQLPLYEALNAREAAMVEALHGDFGHALEMYDVALDALHRAGAGAHLSITVASMAAFFARFDEPEVAATLIGVALRQSGTVSMAIDVDATAELLRGTMDRFDECVGAGSAMSRGDAVRFARSQIAALRAAKPDTDTHA